VEAWAIAAPGLEPLLEAELRALGIAGRADAGGVAWMGDLRSVMRANLHSRLATRVLVRAARFRATTFWELERLAAKVEWGRFVAPGAAVAFRVTCRKSKLYHSDAVAERLGRAVTRAVKGTTWVDAPEEPEGDDAAGVAPAPAGVKGIAAEPQLFIARFDHDQLLLSADSSGAPLYMRGWRQAVAKAPLRETLAAALLVASGWEESAPLLDPMCGSGTIAIEGALRARRIAPGLGRSFAFERWPRFDAAGWAALREEARAAELPRAPAPIVATDRDEGAIAAARANAARAGVEGDIRFGARPLSALAGDADLAALAGGAGWLVSNPPYGVRVGDRDRVRDLWSAIGRVARERLPRWTIALLSPEERLEGQVGLEFREALRTRNGGIPVRVVVGRGE
jgi:putative N6-adenine-specific DNA methylase